MNQVTQITICLNSHYSPLPKDYIPTMQMLIGQGTLDMTSMTPAPIFLQWDAEQPMDTILTVSVS